METSVLDLDKVVQKIAEQPLLTCRLALMKVADRHTVLHAIADVCTSVEDLSWAVYNYGEVAFIEDTITGEQLATWLRTGNGSAAKYEFSFPKLQPSVSVSHWPSHARQASVYCLTNPHTLYQLRSSDAERGIFPKFAPLVRDNCPIFPDYTTAAFRLLLDLERRPGLELSNDPLVVRIADREAWIESVILGARRISVSVEGCNVQGTRLTIGGANHLDIDQRLQEAGPITFEIPRGLPERVWIILSRGDSWLDTRDLEPRRGSLGIRWNNVFMEPGSLCEQLQEIIQGGECATVEFKEQLPHKDQRFLKTVAAFANGRGGTILLGVVNGTGEIRGIADDIPAYKDRITNSIRSNVVPEPEFQVEHCQVGSHQLVAVFVQEGDNTPYGLNHKGLTFYVRRNANTFEATQPEVRALSIKNYSVDDRDGYPQS